MVLNSMSGSVILSAIDLSIRRILLDALSQRLGLAKQDDRRPRGRAEAKAYQALCAVHHLGDRMSCLPNSPL